MVLTSLILTCYHSVRKVSPSWLQDVKHRLQDLKPSQLVPLAPVLTPDRARKSLKRETWSIKFQWGKTLSVLFRVEELEQCWEREEEELILSIKAAPTLPLQKSQIQLLLLLQLPIKFQARIFTELVGPLEKVVSWIEKNRFILYTDPS